MPSINILVVDEECDNGISDIPRVENLVEKLKMMVSQFLFSFSRRNNDFDIRSQSRYHNISDGIISDETYPFTGISPHGFSNKHYVCLTKAQ